MFRKYIALLIFFTGSVTLLGAQVQNPLLAEWLDPYTAEVAKEYPRAMLIPFQHRDSALKKEVQKSTYFQSLTKNWKFRLADRPSAVIRDFTDPGYDVSGWTEVSVPGSWQLSGHGSLRYSGQPYPYTADKSRIPDPQNAPVGMFRTTFKIPYLWSDRQTFLHLGSVKAGTTVWINGQKAGYSEDSGNPAEFDVTPYVVEGLNTLALEVHSAAASSILESQNAWPLNGVLREVYLISQPRVRVRDIVAEATLDPSHTNGNLDLAVVIKSHFLNQKDVTIYYDLYGPDGKLVAQEKKNSKHKMRNEDTVYFRTHIPGVKKWSAETPALYTVLVRLQRDMRFAEHMTLEVGFRNVETSAQGLKVNGRLVRLKGVVYREFHPEKGYVTDSATIRQDMETMKMLGVNALRTGGWPLSDYFYDMADRYGFYVFDQANIDSKSRGFDRGKGGTPANDPQWLNAHLDRIMGMYERNKNRPSVVAWSMGSDAGNGYNFYKAYQWLKQREKNRPVLYSGAGDEWNSDFVFAQVSAMGDLSTQNPVVIAAFVPGLKNADQFEQFVNGVFGAGLQGGFFAPWKEEALSRNGSLNYGTEGANAQVAVVMPFGELSSSAPTLAKAFTPVRITPLHAATGEFEITNGYDFLSLSGFQLEYRILRDAKTVKTGTLDLSAKPGQSERVLVPIPTVKGASGVEIYIYPAPEAAVNNKRSAISSAAYQIRM